MKRIVLWFMSTLSVVVLLFGYKTSTSASGLDTANSASLKPVTISSSPTTGSSTTPASPRTSTATSAKKTSATKAAITTKTVTGQVIQTRWGPVQVQVKVTSGKITTVSVLQYPSGGRSDEINSYALPMLVSETVKAQSANIAMVSGATYTSDGYVQSLQSALDRAGL
ncbi:MAG: FMN-binding protein [Marmoricola sp.]